MQTTNQSPTKLTLGAVVETFYRQGRGVAANEGLASNLAARRLERVLARRGNAGLAAALANLAQELGPASSGARRPSHSNRVLVGRAA